MHEEKRSRLSSLFTNGSCYLTLVDISVKYQTEEKLKTYQVYAPRYVNKNYTKMHIKISYLLMEL
jgi:hypothetical protein